MSLAERISGRKLDIERTGAARGRCPADES
jgi:hypothetical protein